ncbi:MAG: hypothetical protein V3U20_07055 [Thermoplasmata archaeon]
MSWKRISITIFLIIILLNILQINIFLLLVYGTESTPMIEYVWYGEVLLAVGLGLFYIYYHLHRKRKKRELPHEIVEIRPRGEVKITSTVGYNGASLYYQVTIDNRTAFPLSDVFIKPSLSNEIFTLEKEKKSLPVIRPYDSNTVKFSLIPKPEEGGEAQVLGRVDYYNPGIDEYEEHRLKPETIKITWPVLRGMEIEKEEWENVTSTLLRAEEIVEDFPLSGEKCRNLALDIIKKKCHIVSSEETNEEHYKATTKFYSVDETGLKYAGELIVTAKNKDETPSGLKIVVYAENKESLAGLYNIINHGINKGIETAEKETAEAKIPPASEISTKALGVMEPMHDLYAEFDRLRERVKTIEKDKVGVDSQYKSLYELDELYKILAEDLVKRKIVDIKAGEEIVKKKLTNKQLDELKRIKESYDLLCEAETSDSVLKRKDFPHSGKKAILLVYFNAVEVYVRERLKELLPKGVTVLLGENHGHINTRKKDWEKSWAVLSLGSCIHIINHNGYLFLKNEELWKQRVETLMHQVRELRNIVAHPSKENPDPKLVREKVYKLLRELPEVLKVKA